MARATGNHALAGTALSTTASAVAPPVVGVLRSSLAPVTQPAQPPRRPKPNPKATGKQPLTSEARKRLKDAVDGKKWQTFLRELQAYEFTGEDIRARDVLLIAPYVRHYLAESHDTWNQRCGSFAAALNFKLPTLLEDEPVTFEGILEADGWALPKTREEQAYANGFLNMVESLDKGHKLTMKFAPERARVAWRESYNEALFSMVAALAAETPTELAEQLINAPSLPGDTQARSRRKAALQELADASDLSKVLARYDFAAIDQTYRAYAGLADVEKGTPKYAVDVVELVLPYLNRRKPSDDDLLRSKLYARDGHSCAICDQAEEATGYLKAVQTSPTKTKSKNPEHYALACAPCSKARRR